jgi:hypothetical protein
MEVKRFGFKDSVLFLKKLLKKILNDLAAGIGHTMTKGL